MFVGHGNLQHARSGWKGHHALRNHIYVKPVDYNLKDTVMLEYGDSLNPEGFRKVQKGGASTPVLNQDKNDGGSAELQVEKWTSEMSIIPNV